MANGLDELVNIPRLTAWLDANLPQLGDGPLQVEMVHGGFSNVILSLDRGNGVMMLRRPPVTPPPGSERTALREARVLSALDRTAVPHPRCFASCDDPDVIGAVFYVMERVEGWSGKIVDRRAEHPAPFNQPPFAWRLPYAVMDALVALGNVDYEAVGLGDFGKTDRFLERQVDRWSSQLASYKDKYGYAGRELPGYAETERWLRDNTPVNWKPGIIHGDLGTPNMLFSHEHPVRVNALIDWELSTVGDPMIDIGWFLGGLRDEREPDVVPNSMMDAANMPTRQELARYYASGTGRDVSMLDYYLVLARFKGGCIMEYKVAQAAAGKLSREIGDFFADIVADSFASAADIVRKYG